MKSRRKWMENQVNRVLKSPALGIPIQLAENSQMMGMWLDSNDEANVAQAVILEIDRLNVSERLFLATNFYDERLWGASRKTVCLHAVQW